MVGKASIAVGLWGGISGLRWDDSANYNGITHISILYGDCIDSISVIYDNNGVPVSEGRHGGNGGIPAEISLNYPEEHIIGASEHYGFVAYAKTTVLRSLTIVTNLRRLGPFGPEAGTFFSLPIEGGRIASQAAAAVTSWMPLAFASPRIDNIFNTLYDNIK